MGLGSEDAKEVGLTGFDIGEIAEHGLGLEEIPVLGTAVNGVESLYYSAKSGVDVLKGDDEAAYEDSGEAVSHAVKAIPGVGTGIGLYEMYNHATGHNMQDFNEMVSEKFLHAPPNPETHSDGEPYSVPGEHGHDMEAIGKGLGMTLGTAGGPLGMYFGEKFGGLAGSLFD
jgi:hypothetical protein